MKFVLVVIIIFLFFFFLFFSSVVVASFIWFFLQFEFSKCLLASTAIFEWLQIDLGRPWPTSAGLGWPRLALTGAWGALTGAWGALRGLGWPWRFDTHTAKSSYKIGTGRLVTLSWWILCSPPSRLNLQKKNFFHPIFLVIFFLLFFPSLSLSLSMAFQNKNKMETEKKNIENSDQKLFVFFCCNP